MKKLLFTTALCSLFLLGSFAHADVHDGDTMYAKSEGSDSYSKPKAHNKALLYLDGHYSWTNSEKNLPFSNELKKHKLPVTFGIGGMSGIMFSNNLEVGVAALIQYGPNLIGNYERRNIKKIPTLADLLQSGINVNGVVSGTASFVGTQRPATNTAGAGVGGVHTAGTASAFPGSAGAIPGLTLQLPAYTPVGTINTANLLTSAQLPTINPTQVNSMQKDGTFDHHMSQAYFYVYKGEKSNPMIFQLGKTKGVTEIFGNNFHSIMYGANDARFATSANLEFESKTSAPGFQIGEDATFAKGTGQIGTSLSSDLSNMDNSDVQKLMREKMNIIPYAAMYSEMNYRYAPKINFISPSFYGLRAGISYTPDGGDGGTISPITKGYIPHEYNLKSYFPGDYKHIVSGGVNYWKEFEDSNIVLSLSALGEYAKHEKSCHISGKCTQNYYNNEGYSLSGMLSWNNFSVFANYFNHKNTGQKRNLATLDVADYIKSVQDVTAKGIMVDYKSDALPEGAAGYDVATPATTIATSLTANNAGPAYTANTAYAASADLGLTGDEIAVANSGYAEITRKLEESYQWSIGASYMFDVYSFGISYLRTKTAQNDIYGGNVPLDRVTAVASYKIQSGDTMHSKMTPYVEVSWYQAKDKSTLVDKDVVKSVTPSDQTTAPAAGTAASAYDQVIATDFTALTNKAGLNGAGTAGTAGNLPAANSVKYLNQIGKFDAPHKGPDGWLFMIGIKFEI